MKETNKLIVAAMAAAERANGGCHGLNLSQDARCAAWSVLRNYDVDLVSKGGSRLIVDIRHSLAVTEVEPYRTEHVVAATRLRQDYRVAEASRLRSVRHIFSRAGFPVSESRDFVRWYRQFGHGDCMVTAAIRRTGGA